MRSTFSSTRVLIYEEEVLETFKAKLYAELNPKPFKIRASCPQCLVQFL